MMIVLPCRVLCTDVVNGPDGPELDSLLLLGNQEREEGFEGSENVT